MSDFKLSERFAENLMRHRESADLSQEELGFRAGLHRTEIGILEKGRRMPRLDTIIRLAGGLDVTPCELIENMAWSAGHFSPGSFDLTESGDV